MDELRSTKVHATILILALMLGISAERVDAQTKLLRFPDLHDDRVVFTYAGDLWLAPADGGSAVRLTSHPGVELFAKFSPDGRYIAFTGQYDGDEQVYVVPTAVGIPQQLTFYPAAGPLPPRWGYDNQVYGWSPAGDRVLFRSLRDGWDMGDSQLFTVPIAGGLPTALPMPESGAGDFSPDGKRVVYSPLSRDFRHWKRYQGGWAQELYLFDLASHETTRVTHHERADRDPMWIGDAIYFTSDRDGKNNLFRYDVTDTTRRQLTRHREWDVRWPSADPARGRIVYELAGELQVFDLATETSRPLSIRVPDDGVAKRPSRVSVAGMVRDIGLSPQGERALVAARGDIFTVPIEHGPTRNLTRTSGAHDREPAWSPDGRQIAFVSDQDGEEEIWLVDQDGKTPPRQLTDGHQGRLHDLAWSPDGERIAYRDQGQRLYVAEVSTGDTQQIVDDPAVFGLTFAWSPHGGHLAFSVGEANGNRSLGIWSVGGRARMITSDRFTERSPSWGPNGDYLFYLSPREWRPQIGSFEFDYVLDREVLVYALALREDVAHPLPPRSDEATVEEAGDDAEEKGESQDGAEADGTGDA
ncbi:MAG: peptidase S41, partial [Acidobacteriota bacterium]